MESPKRKAQKSRDYRRHRMMRLLNRRKAAAQKAMSEIAERELMRRLRITPLKKFEDGKDAEYNAGVLDDIVITGNRRPANIMFDKDTGNYYRESTGDVVIPVNKLVEDDPSTWSFTDKNGTTFTPHGPVFNSNQGEIRQAEEAPFLSNNYIKQAAHNYMSELAYDINNNRVVSGKYTMPAIALAPVLSNPVGEAAINSAFSAHGLNHAVNEGVDGFGDAVLTGLEIAPLGQLARPLYTGVLKSGIRQYNPRHIIKQITAENAASITPEQWTAAQDAAIARGNTAEAQRLRDLHGAVNNYHSGFYHETKEPFVKFNRPGKNSTGDLLSPFGVFTKRTNKSIGLGEYQMPLNVRYKNPLHVKDKRELFEMLPKDLQKEINTLYRYQFHNTDQSLWNKRAFSAKQKIGKFLSDNNYDALIIDKDWAGTGLVESERWTDATIVPSPGRIKSADAVTFDDNGVRIPLGKRDNFNINDIRYDINDPDFESFTIPVEDLQTSLNAPINNPVIINGKEYPTMKTLMNKVEMIKPNELNAAHQLAQKEIRMYLESPEYRQRLINNGFDPDKYISALEHYLGSRVKYGDLNSGTRGVTEIVNGEPKITLNNSVFDTDYDTLIHELAHAQTKNLDHSMYVKNFIDARLKDIMQYNEKILPQLDKDVAARSGVSIDKLTYLNDPQEIRARMISVIMDARRKGIKLSEYIDRVKSNRQLNDLKSFLKVEDIKKYGASVLSVTPFAIPLAKKNKQKGTK